MRKSKYLNQPFDNGWRCTYVGYAYVQGKKAKAPGKINYYYIFERETSDSKADKMIRLNSTEAVKVWRGETTVEAIAESRLGHGDFDRKISYHFYSK